MISVDTEFPVNKTTRTPCHVSQADITILFVMGEPVTVNRKYAMGSLDRTGMYHDIKLP